MLLVYISNNLMNQQIEDLALQNNKKDYLQRWSFLFYIFIIKFIFIFFKPYDIPMKEVNNG